MRPGAFSIGMIPTCTDRQGCARIIGQGYQSTEYKRYQNRWQRPRLRGGQEGVSGHILPVPQLHAHDEVGRHKSFAAKARPCDATPAAASCRLAIYERYTQEGSSDLADSVMAEIRPTEYVSGRAPAAHEHLARTARAKARTSAASYAAVGIKARVPPVLWPGRFVDPAVRPVRAVVLLRASVVSFGKDGTTCT